MAVTKHVVAVLVLLLLLAAHTDADRETGVGFKPFDDKGGAVAVADLGAAKTPPPVKPQQAAIAAAGSSVNTDNSYDLCYDVNANRTTAFFSVAYYQGKYLQANQFMADFTCYLQWLPIRSVRVNGVLVPVSCECLDPAKCGKKGAQPCCRESRQWRAANNWAMNSAYVYRSPDASTGDGYVCEWIQTRPVQGFGIYVTSVSYSVVTLA